MNTKQHITPRYVPKKNGTNLHGFVFSLAITLISSCYGENTRYISDIDQHPYIGQLELSGGRCSASLIAPNLILTAAHCLTNRKGEIKKGIKSAELTFPNSALIPNEVFRPLRVYFHPGHLWKADDNLDTVVFDAAVVKLDREVKEIQPAVISDWPFIESLDPEEKISRATVAGYGARKATLTQQYYNVQATQCITNNVCLLGTEKPGTINGESGGPILKGFDSNEVIGIIVGSHESVSPLVFHPLLRRSHCTSNTAGQESCSTNGQFVEKAQANTPSLTQQLAQEKVSINEQNAVEISQYKAPYTWIKSSMDTPLPENTFTTPEGYRPCRARVTDLTNSKEQVFFGIVEANLCKEIYFGELATDYDVLIDSGSLHMTATSTIQVNSSIQSIPYHVNLQGDFSPAFAGFCTTKHEKPLPGVLFDHFRREHKYLGKDDERNYCFAADGELHDQFSILSTHDHYIKLDLN